MAKDAKSLKTKYLADFTSALGIDYVIAPDSAIDYLFTMMSEIFAEAYTDMSLIISGESLENNEIPEVLQARAELFNYTIPGGSKSRVALVIEAGDNRVFINQGASVTCIDEGVSLLFESLEAYTIEANSSLTCFFEYPEEDAIYISDNATFTAGAGFSGNVENIEFDSLKVGKPPPTSSEVSVILQNRSFLNTAISVDAICYLIKDRFDLSIFTAIENNSSNPKVVGDITIAPWHVAFIAYPKNLTTLEKQRLVNILNYLLVPGVSLSIPADNTKGFYFSGIGESGLKRDLGVFYPTEIIVAIEISNVQYARKSNGAYYDQKEVYSSVRQAILRYFDQINLNRDPVLRPVKAAAVIISTLSIDECVVRINVGSGFVSTNYAKQTLEVLTLSTITYV